MEYETIQMTRQQVYDLVWSKPITQIAKEYGGSDVSLGKRFRELNIPLPGVGYWRKIETGKTVERPPLPEPERTDVLRLNRYIVNDTQPQDDTSEETPEEVPAYVAFEKLHENRITVTAELIDPHPLVKQAQRALEAGKPDELYGRLIPKSEPCLDIRVGRECLDRALRIMDAIVKALAKRGVKVHATSPRGTYVTLQDEVIFFGLDEHLKIENKPSRLGSPTSFAPGGTFTLVIRNCGKYYQSRWNDTRKRPLERCLNQFLIGLYDQIEGLKQDRLRWEREKREREERWRAFDERARKEEENKRLQQIEEEKLKGLETMISNWRRAHDIRTFVDAVNSAHGGNIAPDSELGLYLDWALGKAAQLDPLTPRQSS